tara:strand:+ start:714 stop:1337 length:624 start_codon:yes stop_codon:yes gene_type:complete
MPFSISIAEVRQHLANIHGDHIELHQRLAGESDTASSERLHPHLPRSSASLNSNTSAGSLFASSFRSDEGAANDGGLHSTGLQPPWVRRHFRSIATMRSPVVPPCWAVGHREAEKREAFGRLSAAIEDVAGLVKDAQYMELFDAAKVVFDAWGRNDTGSARMADDVLADEEAHAWALSDAWALRVDDVLAYEQETQNIWRGRGRHDL